MLSKSWINPVTVRYGKDYTTRFKDRTVDTGTFSVFIDQPIFRSGGIYYAIKYSGALRDANEAELKLQKRKMIGDAVSILFSLKKNRLEQRKMRLLVKNDKIIVMGIFVLRKDLRPLQVFGQAGCRNHQYINGQKNVKILKKDVCFF